MVIKFEYKGEKYLSFQTAKTLNGGEYYISWNFNGEEEPYLIPADSEEVVEMSSEEIEEALSECESV